tara:strand:- start:7974 stop:8144 length:171 start_codon:yes stop_codon:yes gene_type:complete
MTGVVVMLVGSIFSLRGPVRSDPEEPFIWSFRDNLKGVSFGPVEVGFDFKEELCLS